MNFSYTPSKADSSVFDALGKAPAGQYANIARWYRHIASFSSNERSAWTGTPCAQVAGGSTTTKPAAEDDDDVDLFGSDEEDNAEAEKLKEERLKAYNEKKSKKPALIAKSSIILGLYQMLANSIFLKFICLKLFFLTLSTGLLNASKFELWRSKTECENGFENG